MNPDLIEVTRGGLVESRHRGAVAVSSADGRTAIALGDVETPVFPRSTIKIFQAIPLIETGAGDAYQLEDADLALACASHSGAPIHTKRAAALLARAGLSPDHLACGAHRPIGETYSLQLAQCHQAPTQLHNNCSGKHAAMLLTAKHMREPLAGYTGLDHPVQARIRQAIEAVCDTELHAAHCAKDGCSVPNWAMPLTVLARGFARLADDTETPAHAAALRRLRAACWAAPDYVAGAGRLDTRVLRAAANEVFLKTGAEGVYGAGIVSLGIGIALKIEDGGKRAAEAAISTILAELFQPLAACLKHQIISTVRGARVGEVRPSNTLRDFVKQLRHDGRFAR